MVLNNFEVGDIIRIDWNDMGSQYYIFTPMPRAGLLVNLTTGKPLFGGANILALDNETLNRLSTRVEDWAYIGREESGLRELVRDLNKEKE